MEENILFNLGNAIASNFDPKELERKVQLESGKGKRHGKILEPGDHLVIVKDPESGEMFLFDTADQEKDPTTGKEFKIEKHL